MPAIVMLNIVGILAIAALIGFFAESGSRLFAFLMSLYVLFAASLFGWMIFVAVHFISKYW